MRRLCGVKFMAKIERALLSVYDKAGLMGFAEALVKAGVELISTGGTAKALRAGGLPVTDLSSYTGFPEMLDGRVKTLHPKIHGGLLYLRGHAEHEAAVAKHGIRPIDLVAVNLYPFEQTIAKPNVTMEEAIENIDIGGPSMLRSAAKNHRSVTVIVDPADYGEVGAQIQAAAARRRSFGANWPEGYLRARRLTMRASPVTWNSVSARALRRPSRQRRLVSRSRSRSSSMRPWPRHCGMERTRISALRSTDAFRNFSNNCTARNCLTTTFWI